MTEQKKLNKEISGIKHKQKLIIDKNLSGVYSDSTTKELISNLEELLAEKEEFLNNLAEDTLLQPQVIISAIAFLSKLDNVWLNIEDIEVKHRFQKWLFHEGIWFNGKEFGTTKLPLCISIKRDFSEEKFLMVNLKGTHSDIFYRDWETDRKSTRLNSSHSAKSRMPSSA